MEPVRRKRWSHPPILVNRGLLILMYNNCITSGNKRFFKKKVTATGASVSAAYANIYVCAELTLTDKGLARPYKNIDLLIMS